MAYTMQTWVDGAAGNTPLNATRLNYIEAGVAAAYGQVGLAAAIPAASATNKGTWFWASDTGAFSFSDGTAWHAVSSAVSSFNTRTGAITLSSADVTTALGFTPPTSVFGRTGAVVAAAGDYTAAQVTNAADKSTSAQQVFLGELKSPDVAISGLTGAVNATRIVGSTGATTGGAPTTGTFAQGDLVVDPKNGAVWICTAAGTPGTWANAAAGGTSGVSSFNSRTGAVAPGNADYLAVATGGLAGAIAATRFVGGTASGAPAGGTFAIGDFLVDQTGKVWICTTAGTPGTWVNAAPVSSAFGRTGAVVATSGDYTAAQVTNAADKSSGTAQAFTGNVQAPAIIAAGLTGATAASRYVGALATGGTPASGTFAVGDHLIGQDGTVWICTAAGTPGTWAKVGGGSSGALTLISSQTLASAALSVTFSSIPSTYSHLRLVGSARSTNATTSDVYNIRFNADTGFNYDSLAVVAATTGTPSAIVTTAINHISSGFGSGEMPAANCTAGIAGHLLMDIPLYAGTTWKKVLRWWAGFADPVFGASATVDATSNWRSTAAITSLAIAPNSGSNFAAGTSFSLYGVS